jgi:NAD(P)H-dependent FMN reductase
MVYVPKILAFAGSARGASFNKMLVKNALLGAERAGATVTFVDMRDFPLPLYDADLEAAEGIPQPALAFKALMKSNDGFLISSPEYNSSLSPLIKNVIDWTSRPVQGEPAYSGFEGKIAAVMAASTGALGGIRALAHLRALLANMRVFVIPDQKAVPNAAEVFDKDGSMTDQKTRKAVQEIAAKLAYMIAKLNG